MSERAFPTLRQANAARQAEWDRDNRIGLSYRGNELAGEVGEACNVLKKLERERLGIRGSRATIAHLAEELADVVICADLIAMMEGVDLDAAVEAKFNATSESVGLSTRYQRAADQCVAFPSAARGDQAEALRVIATMAVYEDGAELDELTDIIEACRAVAAAAIQPDKYALTKALRDVAAERQRQQTVEGWTPEHDDKHTDGELALAAACYAHENLRAVMFGNPYAGGLKPGDWPFEASWWKPKDRRHDLVRAGALILAEIERLDRAEAATAASEPADGAPASEATLKEAPHAGPADDPSRHYDRDGYCDNPARGY